VIFALTVLVGSAMEVAVTFTEPPVGTVAGAVYVVLSALVVWTGLKDPQSVDPQRTVHFTPASDVSLFSTARNAVLAPAFIVDGGAGANPTVTGLPPMVSVTLETLLGSAVAEA
jgi:hypothetical protein